MSESPVESRPTMNGILCPACNKVVWPYQEMDERGKLADKCPTQGCGASLTHLITDEQRDGHATSTAVRADPNRVATPPLPTAPAAGDIASQVVAALAAAGVLLKPGPVSDQLALPAPDPPQPPAYTPTKPQPSLAMLADLLNDVVTARIQAIGAEREALTRVRKQLEQVL